MHLKQQIDVSLVDFPASKATEEFSKTMMIPFLNDRHTLSDLSKKQLGKEQLMEIDASRTRMLFSPFSENRSRHTGANLYLKNESNLLTKNF